MTPYWQDKIARIDRIEVPCYVVGSWTNPVHTPGTFDAWRQLRTPERWLRVHNQLEWSDFYRESSQLDLLRFFDHYLKGVDNGWTQTPPVRLSVLGAEGRDEVDRPLAAFPPPAVRLQRLALGPGRFGDAPPDQAQAVHSRGPDDELCFEMPVTQDGEWIGFSSLRLHVQLHNDTDQDLFVALERLDARERPIAMRTVPLPHPLLDPVLRWVHRRGWAPALNLLFPTVVEGKLRLSHRTLDQATSRPERPLPSHLAEVPMTPGQIVPVDIALDPVAWKLQRGQTLRLRISGHNLSPVPMADVPVAPPRGSGRYTVWVGGTCHSHLLCPLTT
jgi:uncharacterized protein